MGGGSSSLRQAICGYKNGLTPAVDVHVFLPKDQNCCFPAATKWSGDLIKGGWHSQWDQNLVHEGLEMACEYCTI